MLSTSRVSPVFSTLYLWPVDSCIKTLGTVPLNSVLFFFLQLCATGVESKLLNYEGRKGAYYYDYVIQPAGQPKRHLTTLFALITISGTGECLATYTTSCLEDQWTVLEPVFDKITKSFRVGL